MIVRCGSCRTEFDVPGAGRFACPVCGSVNMVRGAGGVPPGGGMPPPPPGGGMGAPPGGMPGAPPPPRPPDPPSPKIQCPECDFSFIVGQIEVAECPNCGSEVSTGWSAPEGEG